MEKLTGWERVIWTQDLGKRQSDHPPFDQGLGYLKLIQWSDDSTEVHFAYRYSGEVTEWLTVKLDAEGKVVSTEKEPGARFPSIDSSRLIHAPAINDVQPPDVGSKNDAQHSTA